MPLIESPRAEPAVVKDHAVEQEALEQYYKRFFPFRQTYQWLNHSPSPSNDFAHRELAFTINTGDDGETYLRYQSYGSAEAFRKDVLKLMPTRFEIGPVYSLNPRDRKQVAKNAFKPIAKELVFDIDLTDYDSIRTCCQDKKICERCWRFITVAVKTIDGALREDFGFSHILWVYSGRRGAHAWVCDKRARDMDDQKRRAVATYLNVIGTGHHGKAVSVRRPFHPHIARSFELLKRDFAQFILEDQDPWLSSKGAELLLQRIPDAGLVDALKKKWGTRNDIPSLQRWKDIDDLAEKGVSKTLRAAELLEAKKDIILEYLYPRLDIEVSKHLNHLLKAPFCVHPSTGRVCVPMDPAKIHEFNPMLVPTINVLLDELDAYEVRNLTEPRHDFEKTSLKEYVDYFQRFVTELNASEHREKRERDEPGLAF